MLSSGAFCFMVTLFNLQGTRCFALADSLLSLSHSSSFVKSFFSKLFELVRDLLFAIELDSFHSLPYLSKLVKNFFQILSETLSINH